MNVNKEKLFSYVDLLRGKKVLIVGDVGLDEYVIGSVRRISPEAPVPVLEVGEQDQRLGLASNVAANVASLGGVPYLVGVVGQDQTAEIFKQQLKSNNCSAEYLIVDSARPTTKKLRVMAAQHHIVRVDFERKKYLTPEIEKKLISRVDTLMPEVDAVIIEDYSKGVLSENVIQKVIESAKRNKKFVALDPNSATATTYYSGVDYVTPNTSEALKLSNLKIDDLSAPSESLHEVGKSLLDQLGAKAVIITRGKDGMSLYENNGKAEGEHIPTFARTVFDVTGAGDTVIATFTLSLSAGLSLIEACTLSNYAAGVVVGKIGCVSCSPNELKEYIKEVN
ncbi:MAG: D-glycero-beta-D-manno-heptose-7-phosphate kinase [Oligoflexia bacterium]|nr:D-glycero-beta-D-manno-heptose-7-phosphate kinase [Oligoflexia bacterium]